jgi:hypothetical protein
MSRDLNFDTLSTAKRHAVILDYARDRGKHSFQPKDMAALTEDHMGPRMVEDLTTMTNFGKLTLKGEGENTAYLKNLNSNGFGDTSTAPQLMMWHELLHHEYGQADLTTINPNFKLKRPWDKKQKPRVRPKLSGSPQAVQLFVHKLTEVGRQYNSQDPANALTNILRELDTDSDGRLTSEEVRAALRGVFRIKMSPGEVNDVLAFYKCDRGGLLGVGWQDFVRDAALEECLQLPWSNEVDMSKATCTARRSLGLRPPEAVRAFQLQLRRAAAHHAVALSALQGVHVSPDGAVRAVLAAHDTDADGRLAPGQLAAAAAELFAAAPSGGGGGGGRAPSGDALQQVVTWYDKQGRGTAACEDVLRDVTDSSVDPKAPEWWDWQSLGVSGLAPASGVVAAATAVPRSTRAIGRPGMGMGASASVGSLGAASARDSGRRSGRQQLLAAAKAAAGGGSSRRGAGAGSGRSLPLSFSSSGRTSTARERAALTREKLQLQNELLRLKIKIEGAGGEALRVIGH